jgi:hypothetical protein
METYLFIMGLATRMIRRQLTTYSLLLGGPPSLKNGIGIVNTHSRTCEITVSGKTSCKVLYTVKDLKSVLPNEQTTHIQTQRDIDAPYQTPYKTVKIPR